MKYFYTLINPDNPSEVLATGRLHFLNKRTVADAIRRKIGDSTKPGETLVIEVRELVWELQSRASRRPLYRMEVIENKYARNA